MIPAWKSDLHRTRFRHLAGRIDRRFALRWDVLPLHLAAADVSTWRRPSPRGRHGPSSCGLACLSIPPSRLLALRPPPRIRSSFASSSFCPSKTSPLLVLCAFCPSWTSSSRHLARNHRRRPKIRFELGE